jgi:predicted nucleic acid-binding protein
MIIVIDSSAAVEIILQRKGIKLFKNELEKADWVITPYLYISEITNTFWKYFQFGSLQLDQCEKAIDYALDLPDDFIDEKTLYREAFAMACLTKKPAYDMFFLILARRNNAFLMTKDKSLQQCAKKHSIAVIS